MKTILVVTCMIFGLTACVTTQSKRAGLVNSKEIEPLYLRRQSIVIIAHPFCHFSNNAFHDMSSKTKTQLKTAIIIAPIALKHFDDESNAVDKWNRENELQMTKIDSNDHLSHIDLESTPQFYFFNNGVLIKKIVRWPSDKSSEGLLNEALANQTNPLK